MKSMITTTQAKCKPVETVLRWVLYWNQIFLCNLSKVVPKIWCRHFGSTQWPHWRLHKSPLPRPITIGNVRCIFNLSANCCPTNDNGNSLSQSGTFPVTWRSCFQHNIKIVLNFSVYPVDCHFEKKKLSRLSTGTSGGNPGRIRYRLS